VAVSLEWSSVVSTTDTIQRDVWRQQVSLEGNRIQSSPIATDS